MEAITPPARGLEAAQIEQFITDRFVRVGHAFPRELADEARAILWTATGCSPDDPTTWTQPVIRLGVAGSAHRPVVMASSRSNELLGGGSVYSIG
jgi:hypothetical protein